MLEITYALIPIFGLIVLGQGLYKVHFPGDAFWPLAARLTYFVFFPALLTRTVANAPLNDSNLLKLSVTVVGAVLLVAGGALLLRPVLGLDGPGFSSLFQGSVRHNTYVGLATSAVLLGERGLALAAVALVTLTPLVNVLSVTVLAWFAAGERPTPGRVLRAVVSNPLIIACVVGAVLNLIGLGLPGFTDDFLALLSRAALPLGLLVVGAGLDLGLLRAAVRPVAVGASFKLLLYPLATSLLALAVGLSGEGLTIAIVFTALPCAPSAYILAAELGGDTRLMAAILTGQTVLAMFSLPFMIGWLG
jgi:predicted permease